MASLIDLYTLSATVTFIHRVEQAIVYHSWYVRNAPPGTFGEPEMSYALRVLNDPAGTAAVFAKALAMDSGIAPSAPADIASDAQIKAAVASLWTSFSKK